MNEFIRNLKKNKLITFFLIVIIFSYLVINFKTLSFIQFQKVKKSEFLYSTHDKDIGYLNIGKITGDYENIYYELNNIDGVEVDNFSVDLSEINEEEVTVVNVGYNYFKNFLNSNSKSSTFKKEDFHIYGKEGATIPILVDSKLLEESKLNVGDEVSGKCYDCGRNGVRIRQTMGTGQIYNEQQVGQKIDSEYVPPEYNVKYEIIGTLDENFKMPGVEDASNKIIKPFMIDKASLTPKEQTDYQENKFVFPMQSPLIILDYSKISYKEFDSELNKLANKYSINIEYSGKMNDFLLVQETLANFTNISTILFFQITGLILIIISILLYKIFSIRKQEFIIYILNGSRNNIVFKQLLLFITFAILVANMLSVLWILLTNPSGINWTMLLIENSILYLIIFVIIILIDIKFKKNPIKTIINIEE